MITGTPPANAANRADNIVARFIDRATSDPERLALVLYPSGTLQALGALKWGDWITSARASSGAFLARLAPRGARVAVFAENRALWPVAAMSAAMCGMIVTAIPADSNSAQLLARLADSGAIYIVTDTLARFKQVRALLHQLSQELTIICDDLEPLRTSIADGVFEWDTWCRYGAQALNDYQVLRDRLRERVDAILPADAATLTYEAASTSGIVRTYETLLADAVGLEHAIGLTATDRIACAMPLAAPFHRAFAIDAAIVAGCTVALIERSSEAFTATRKADATILLVGEHGLTHVRNSLHAAREANGYLRDATCELVGRHCRMLLSAECTCSSEFAANLRAGGVALVTAYTREWQACICLNGPARFDSLGIGQPFAGTELHVGDHDELLVRRGAHLAAGVFAGDAAGAAPFSHDGAWYRTGDRVQQHTDGSMVVTGRMSDMLQFSTGRLLAPHPIEASLEALPLVQHAMCDADGAHSLVAIIALDRNATERWARTRGLLGSWEALVEHPVVYEELSRGVASINGSRDTGERLTAFALTDLEFSAHTGELHHDGRINRTVVNRRFHHVLVDLHQRRML
ncbi:MAG: AMP-binding protein [Gemmatimonas sp.]